MTASYDNTKGGCPDFFVSGYTLDEAGIRTSTQFTLIDPPQAWIDVFRERNRQVQVEGFDADHDDGPNNPDELCQAARCYANPRATEWRLRYLAPAGWPWDWTWWKPRSLRENLVRAAALLLAAIEHIDRAVARKR